MNISSYGMRILAWNTLIRKSMFLKLGLPFNRHSRLWRLNFLDRYLAVVKKHGLEISQPGLEPYEGLTWEMTKKRDDTEVHKLELYSEVSTLFSHHRFNWAYSVFTLIYSCRHAEERNGWCTDPNLPPCAAYASLLIYINRNELSKKDLHRKLIVSSFCWFCYYNQNQVCGDYGSCFLPQGMALCVAYDSGM